MTAPDCARRRTGRPGLRLLAGIVAAVAACSSSETRDPDAGGVRYLIEELGSADVEVSRAPRAAPWGRLELDPEGVARLSVDVPADAVWKRSRPRRRRVLGVSDDTLEIWHLDVRLPTRDAGSVELVSGSGPLPHWRRPTPPRPFSGFYHPGGFVTGGVYLALPAGARPQERPLRLRFRPTTPALVQHLARTRSRLSAELLATDARIGATVRPALSLPAGSAVGFPLSIPAHASLRLSLARTPRPWGEEDRAPASLRVAFRETDGGATLLDEHVPYDEESEGAWRDVEIDLSSLSGREGTLDLELEVDPEAADAFHYVGDPVLVASPGSEREGPSNLVFIVVDGLRADRLADPAAGDALAPELLRLAEEGLRFTAARSPAPWTRPTVGSLFTGVPPSRHGVQREAASDVLPANLPALAEVLRGAGFATAGFSSNLHVRPEFGLHRGFAHLHTSLSDAQRLNESVFGWLDDPGAREPFFLFLFYMDTHHPFRHRPELDRSSGIPAEPPDRRQVTIPHAERRRRSIPAPTPEQARLLEALYDENVRYVDARIADLLDGLEARGLLEDTLLAVTADHGEAFGEHGDFFHGFNLYEELLRVPLILAGDALPARGRITHPVSLVDLPATLLSLLGLPKGALGGSPDRLLRPSGAPIYAETRFRSADAACIVDRPHKLIWYRSEARYELFDLSEDPGEREDRSAREPERVERLASGLRDWLASQRRERVPSPSAPAGELPAGLADRLRSLGYVP